MNRCSSCRTSMHGACTAESSAITTIPDELLAFLHAVQPAKYAVIAYSTCDRSALRVVEKCTPLPVPATGYRLPPISPATGYRLPAESYRLPTTGYRLPATGYRLPT